MLLSEIFEDQQTVEVPTGLNMINPKTQRPWTPQELKDKYAVKMQPSQTQPQTPAQIRQQKQNAAIKIARDQMDQPQDLAFQQRLRQSTARLSKLTNDELLNMLDSWKQKNIDPKKDQFALAVKNELASRGVNTGATPAQVRQQKQKLSAKVAQDQMAGIKDQSKPSFGKGVAMPMNPYQPPVTAVTPAVAKKQPTATSQFGKGVAMPMRPYQVPVASPGVLTTKPVINPGEKITIGGQTIPPGDPLYAKLVKQAGTKPMSKAPNYGPAVLRRPVAPNA